MQAETIADPTLAAPAATSAPRAPWSLTASRAGLRVLAGVSPRLAGKVACDQFLKARSGAHRPPDTVPLGATRVALRSAGRVQRAYAFGASGPCVLLVHGWGADSSSLYGLAGALVRRGYQCFAYDAPAHGVSPGDRTTMTELVDTLGDVLETLGPLHGVIAHSLGGIAAVAAVARHPDARPARLALLGAPASLADLARGFATRLELGPRAWEGLRDELLRRNGVPVEHWDIPALGRDLRMPKLLVHDRDDASVSFRHAQRIAAALRPAELVATEGLGHLRVLADRAVHDRLATFLAG